MSQMDTQSTSGINADNIDMILPGEEPLANLKAVQTDITRWKVLSARNGSVTMHEVSLSSEPTCTCEDMTYNRLDENEVCAHVAKAALVADSVWNPEQMGLKAMLNQLSEAQEATEAVRDLEVRLGRIEQANRIAEGETSATASQDDGVSDPVAAFETFLEEHGLDPDDFDVWMAGDSLQIEQEGRLDDDPYATWMGIVTDEYDDTIWWDADEERNYIVEDNIEAVLE